MSTFNGTIVTRGAQCVKTGILPVTTSVMPENTQNIFGTFVWSSSRMGPNPRKVSVVFPAISRRAVYDGLNISPARRAARFCELRKVAPSKLNLRPHRPKKCNKISLCLNRITDLIANMRKFVSGSRSTRKQMALATNKMKKFSGCGISPETLRRKSESRDKSEADDRNVDADRKNTLRYLDRPDKQSRLAGDNYRRPQAAKGHRHETPHRPKYHKTE